MKDKSNNIIIIKRDGTKVEYQDNKIYKALQSAFYASNDSISVEHSVNQIYEYGKFAKGVQERILNTLLDIKTTTVEDIQDMVVEELSNSEYKDVYKRYILYRQSRDDHRRKTSDLYKTYTEISNTVKNELKNENANVDANTPSGQMLKIASAAAKDYALNYLLDIIDAENHRKGRYHIHDLEWYMTKTTTCVNYNLKKLFEKEFPLQSGTLRTPKRIETAGALTAITFQTNQNLQHGGQSVGALDRDWVPYVKKSFVKNFIKACMSTNNRLNHDKRNKKKSIDTSSFNESNTYMGNELLKKRYYVEFKEAMENTISQTYQTAEGLIGDLNSMHSRAGAQVVFSNINFGTDTSEEGRLIIKSILLAIKAGLGNGETPIFPISIFKIKDGVTFSLEDVATCVKIGINSYEDIEKLGLKFKAPNFDLFVLACETTATRLFPNFSFLDATFNRHEKWREDDPNRADYEVDYMGCRTRTFEDRHGEKTSLEKGNISFTSLDIPGYALQAAEECSNTNNNLIDRFFSILDEHTDLVEKQLLRRFEYQCTAKAKQIPLMTKGNVWKNGNTLGPEDEVREILKHGTLAIGFIGLAETLIVLTGKHHGECEKANELGYKIVEFIKKKCDIYSERNDLNFAVLATPAEGLSGRFVKIDREKYGVIENVTDKLFYTNSFHVPVWYNITANEKIDIEATYHKLCLGGHITYTEMDGEAKKNILAIILLVKKMFLSNIGYGSINHPIDRCCTCGFDGVIELECPVCGERYNLDRIRRITGYLVGTMDRWGDAKKEEESLRVKHSVELKELQP